MIDLTIAQHLPAVMRRVYSVLASLETGVHPLALGGHVLNYDRNARISIPIGRNFRLIVDRQTCEPLKFIGHEAYNKALKK